MVFSVLTSPLPRPFIRGAREACKFDGGPRPSYGRLAVSSSADLPSRPKDESPRELKFEPQTMVRWFDPVQLAGTALQVIVSSFFGAYSDKREIQAAVAPAAKPKHDY